MGMGKSYGAISVINAMPTGIGATIGISLKTTARFTVEGNQKIVRILTDPTEEVMMAWTCVRETYAYLGIEEPFGWLLEIYSDIPISRGLKSSSSACNAIISAVLDEYGRSMDTIEMIRLGVKCAKIAEITVTGAFDDACGCHLGGFVMTDNRKNKIVMKTDVEDLDVVIHVPDRKIRKSTLPVGELKKKASEMKKIIKIAKTDPFKAMTENGRLMSPLSGVENSVAELALENGALGAGMSGSGPAIAILLKKGDAQPFLERTGLTDVIITATRRSVP